MPIIQYQNSIIKALGSIYVQFQVIWTQISELKLQFSTPCQTEKIADIVIFSYTGLPDFGALLLTTARASMPTANYTL